jgi:hypothetical protein
MAKSKTFDEIKETDAKRRGSEAQTQLLRDQESLENLTIARLVKKAFDQGSVSYRQPKNKQVRFIDGEDATSEHIAELMKDNDNALFIRVFFDKVTIKQLTEAGFSTKIDGDDRNTDFIIEFQNNDKYVRFVKLLIKRIADNTIAKAESDAIVVHCSAKEEFHRLEATAKELDVPVNSLSEDMNRGLQKAFKNAAGRGK